MFSKKITLILLVLFVLCGSLTFVSAVEDNSTNQLNVDNFDMEYSPEDDMIVEYSKKGTFTDLNNLIQNASENSIIKLDKDYIYNDNTDEYVYNNNTYFTEDMYLKYGIKISKSLTIDGQGHTIDGNHTAKIFSQTGSILTLSNTIFINGGYPDEILYGQKDYHSAIIYENIRVVNCTFINNTYGGLNFINDKYAFYTYHTFEGGNFFVEVETTDGKEFNIKPNSFSNVINCTFINEPVGDSWLTFYKNCVFIVNSGNNSVTSYNSKLKHNCSMINYTKSIVRLVGKFKVVYYDKNTDSDQYTILGSKLICKYHDSKQIEIPQLYYVDNWDASPFDYLYINLNGKLVKVNSDYYCGSLKPGSYNAFFTLVDNPVFASVRFHSFKIIVKKNTPILWASHKTFKNNVKIKKLYIRLIESSEYVNGVKKVKVYLKIKGKTYKKTTGYDGSVVFKIKNLKKKGTYKAKITFKGNAYFNSKSKTIKIKVK